MPAIHNHDSDNSENISVIEMLKSEKECSKDATFCHRPRKYLPALNPYKQGKAQNAPSLQNSVRSASNFVPDRKRCRCDMLELCHPSSLIVVLVFVLSLTILGNYLLSRCHLLDKHELACTIQMCGTLANFTLVCVLVIILPCYMLHIVETSPNLPWYVFEIFQAYLIAAFNFVLLVLVSIFDDNVTLIGVCGNIQIVLVGFFVMLRYYNYRRGVPPQTYNTDDLSFEYLQQMRNMFKSIK